MPDIITVKQAAQRLHITPRVIREYLRSGRIPGHKIGNTWRILDIDLQHWINPEQRVSALGICAHLQGFGTEEFLKNKRIEVELEEAKSHRRSCS